ncbi:MAG: magnesium chelatase [Sporomusaceae bacterium]|nr:magnesium chelatase [Sporomusaceae bacterium]
MRSVKELLPPILRVKDCIYNCHPESPHCPEHSHLSIQEIINIGSEIVPCPFLEISHAAKIGTVVGSIDLGKLTNPLGASAAILPGTIPQAHRGVIFIDEINRLADASPELADVLLDVMGTKPGHIQIEETGLPTVGFPVCVSVWAASNPDEDPGSLTIIRKQLSDRFDFGINMGRPSEYSAVFNILAQRTGKEKINNEVLIADGVGSLSGITIEDSLRNAIAKIYVDFKLESLRAIEAMETVSSISCLLADRQKVTIADLIHAVPLVLNHRTDKETIADILNYLEGLQSSSWKREGACESQGISERVKTTAGVDQFEKVVWWKNILEKLLSKLKFLNKCKGGADYQGAASENGVMSGGNMKLMDPSKVDFKAPPKKAVPLGELPVEEFISSDHHKPHG